MLLILKGKNDDIKEENKPKYLSIAVTLQHFLYFTLDSINMLGLKIDLDTFLFGKSTHVIFQQHLLFRNDVLNL